MAMYRTGMAGPQMGGGGGNFGGWPGMQQGQAAQAPAGFSRVDLLFQEWAKDPDNEKWAGLPPNMLRLLRQRAQAAQSVPGGWQPPQPGAWASGQQMGQQYGQGQQSWVQPWMQPRPPAETQALTEQWGHSAPWMQYSNVKGGRFGGGW